MRQFSYAGCFGLYLAISAQFTFEVWARNPENSSKPLYFEVHGRSRSSMLILH